MVPKAVLYDPRGRCGLLLVTDEYTGRVILFDGETGNHLRTIENLGLSECSGSHKSLSWSEGQQFVIVSDNLNHRLGYLKPPIVFNAEVEKLKAHITDSFGKSVAVMDIPPETTTLGDLHSVIPVKDDDKFFLVAGDLMLNGHRDTLLQDTLVPANPSFRS